MTQERLTDKELAKLPPLERRKQSLRRNNQDRADGIRSRNNARQQRLQEGLVRDLRNLSPPPPPPTLNREEPPGRIPPARGLAQRNLQPGTGNSGGGSGAPLLTEVPGSREYYATFDRFYSNSYLIFVEVRPLKAMTFSTPDGQQVRHEFELPPEGG